MANRPSDDRPWRDTPEWREFFECRRSSSQRADWWDALGADGDYHRCRALTAFQQDTLQKALEAQNTAVLPASAKKVSWQQEVVTELKRLAEDKALVCGVGNQSRNLHAWLLRHHIPAPETADPIEKLIGGKDGLFKQAGGTEGSKGRPRQR